MHKDYCGKSPCCDCNTPCALDASMYCSPDCKFLGEDGEHMHPECQSCDALPEWQVPICYDGIVCVRAETRAEAVELVTIMPVSDMHKKSCGAWDVGDPEQINI